MQHDEHRQPSGLYLGVDLSTLGQARRGKTQVAVAESTAHGIELLELLSPPDDDALLSLLGGSYALCGVDAPLSLPPCVGCRELPCDCPFARWLGLLELPSQLRFHYRLSDLVVKQTVEGVRPKPPLSDGGPVDITPLTLRWQGLVRRMWSAEYALDRIVEVYATGSIFLYARAFGLAKGKTYPYRASAEARALFLQNLCDVGRLTAPGVLWDQMIESEDSLDAAMAALSAWHAGQRTVLLPEALLGLNSIQGGGIAPLLQIEEAQRVAMAQALRRAPWIMLPDLRGDPLGVF